MAPIVGDLHIKLDSWCTRVTNKYGNWKHLPHDEQTYDERLLSWHCRKYVHEERDDSLAISSDEGMAINGIMALLPSDAVDWDYGPFPDRIGDALTILARHLKSLKS